MKCDELKSYGMDDPAIGEEYEMYKVAEVDAAIDELKTEHHKERHEYIEMAAQLRRENAELKAKLDRAIAERDGNQVCIDALKKKLENVQASMYAEMVDAGMRERKLKRALWLTRAFRARDIQRWWIAVTCSKTTERACSVWNNVERKCRAKAEQYK